MDAFPFLQVHQGIGSTSLLKPSTGHEIQAGRVKDNSRSQVKPGGLQLYWQARTQHLYTQKRHQELSEQSNIVTHAQRLLNIILAGEFSKAGKAISAP